MLCTSYILCLCLFYGPQPHLLDRDKPSHLTMMDVNDLTSKKRLLKVCYDIF